MPQHHATSKVPSIMVKQLTVDAVARRLAFALECVEESLHGTHAASIFVMPNLKRNAQLISCIQSCWNIMLDGTWAMLKGCRAHSPANDLSRGE